MSILLIAATLGTLIVLVAFISLVFRRVVPTNQVHIVQSAKKTTSYGSGSSNKSNTYYRWPSWLPFIGVTTSVLPISVFKLELDGYDAYDKGRVPFEIDVVAFFRVLDSNLAAQRVSSFSELNEQLLFIVKGAARTILASYDIDEIMVERSKFGDHFTLEVQAQLANWGVETVKNIELMDIRDAHGNKVIENIMAKRKSHIEMESRTEVAVNMKQAQIAEITAKQEINIQEQEAKQQVGMRTIEADRSVEISKQAAIQLIKDQEKITAEKQMAITQVNEVKQAEITKQVQTIQADQEKAKATLLAEGQLEKTKREAEGIALTGEAKASAEKALQLAPIQAQITLAKEIGENEGYQAYLIEIRKVEAGQIVGVEQAKALEKADVKIIANTGEPVAGVSNVMELFTPKGGTSIGGMLEGLAQSPEGQKLLGKFGKQPPAAA